MTTACVQDGEEMTNYLLAALVLLERELQVDVMRRQTYESERKLWMSRSDSRMPLL